MSRGRVKGVPGVGRRLVNRFKVMVDMVDMVNGMAASVHDMIAPR